jgi:hypothetical protein
VAGCSAADSTRLGVIVTGMRGGVLMTEELLANGLPVDGIAGSLVGGQPSTNPLAMPADPVSGWWFGCWGGTHGMLCDMWLFNAIVGLAATHRCLLARKAVGGGGRQGGHVLVCRLRTLVVLNRAMHRCCVLVPAVLLTHQLTNITFRTCTTSPCDCCLHKRNQQPMFAVCLEARYPRTHCDQHRMLSLPLSTDCTALSCIAAHC